MQLTGFTDYSVRALIYLATRADQRTTIQDIAEYFDISRNHMVKVIHNLSRRGYIKSQKGKNGGIYPALPPEQINMKDLIKALEPNYNLVECFNKDHNTCRITEICTLKFILDNALENFFNTLAGYTLADVTVDPLLLQKAVAPEALLQKAKSR